MRVCAPKLQRLNCDNIILHLSAARRERKIECRRTNDRIIFFSTLARGMQKREECSEMYSHSSRGFNFVRTRNMNLYTAEIYAVL